MLLRELNLGNFKLFHYAEETVFLHLCSSVLFTTPQDLRVSFPGQIPHYAMSTLFWTLSSLEKNQMDCDENLKKLSIIKFQILIDNRLEKMAVFLIFNIVKEPS